ncbi:MULTISPECIES: DUF2085 domain-containing protein [unclassified Bacillus (in: firmicutes)]|uniref:DUF2085 domain-containing protein n=2 Tax=Bacillales TaxID=1385 RepID=UPI0027E0EB75|nr:MULTISPECIES: DUF2085 domain-containing protein [unclassified Bacillus (in: firmicutes)]
MEKRNIEKRNTIGLQTVIVFRTLMGIVGRIVIVDRIVINKMRLLDIIPCHRMKSRSITIKGYTLPLCARCTGILLGYLFFPFLLIAGIHLSLWLGLLLNVPMVLDGWTQKRKYRMSNNVLRVITGIMSGLGQSVLIVSGSDYIISMLVG